MALDHQLARQWIELAADGLLDAERQAILAEHLAGCAECRTYAAELAELEAALGAAFTAQWGDPQMDPDALERMVEEIKSNPPTGGGGGGSWFASWPARLFGLLVVLVLAALAYFGGQNQSGTEKPTPTATATATLEQIEESSPTNTATPTSTPTATPTPTSTELVLIAIPAQNANCRYGNSSSQFDIADTLHAGEEYTPLAKGPDLLWVYFLGPVNQTHCWVYIETIQLYINDQAVDIAEVPDELLPFRPYPLTPTPTSTPTPVPTSTYTPTPTCTPPSITSPKPNC